MLEDKQLEDLKDKKIAGFMKVGYHWLSELFKNFKVDVPQLEFLNGIEKIKGKDGDKGDTGNSGPPGKDGKDGKSIDENSVIRRLIPLVVKKIPKPEDGKDYTLTENDKQKIADLIPKPKDGEPGKDAKPVTTKEIIDAIKKNLLDISHIKGLEQRLAVSKQRMYGVGPSGALRSVAHDSSIAGDGTPENPLKAVGGGAPTRETPAGDINGVNLTYTITAATTHLIYHNGVLLEEGAGNDYTISATTLTMLWAPKSGKLSHVYWI